MPELIRLTHGDSTLLKKAAVTYARAFMEDPYIVYLQPDKSKRANLKYVYEYYVRLMVAEGDEAYATSPDCEGVAIWVDSQAKPSCLAPLRSGNPLLIFRCGWRYIYEETRIDRQCDKIRKKLAPSRHWYLAWLAVAPEHQGKGYASTLLKPVLRRVDKQHLPAYVETQNKKNVALYRHFGFELKQEIRVPRVSLPMYAMLREAR
jgi:ribosomal protein S18 acetylase RimI-like enzyme